MAERAFSQIAQAEARAKALISDAQEETAQIIARAEGETADAFLQCLETGKRQVLEKKNETEAAAQENSLRFSKETVDLCISVKRNLSARRSSAVEAVLQLISGGE